MDMSMVGLVPALKRVAKNVYDIEKQKDKVKANMVKAKEQAQKALAEKLKALQAEYDALTAEQDLFDAPFKQKTGGYGVKDLVTMEVTAPTSENGRTVVKYELKYPDTVVPPAALNQPQLVAEHEPLVSSALDIDSISEPETTEELQEESSISKFANLFK